MLPASVPSVPLLPSVPSEPWCLMPRYLDASCIGALAARGVLDAPRTSVLSPQCFNTHCICARAALSDFDASEPRSLGASAPWCLTLPASEPSLPLLPTVPPTPQDPRVFSPRCLDVLCIGASVLQHPRSPDAPCIAALAALCASEPQCLSDLAPSISDPTVLASHFSHSDNCAGATEGKIKRTPISSSMSQQKTEPLKRLQKQC
ncbi:UNVERIFIED_CONTAM: hypothetical protein FKN15_034490 [Acipenser sinensis]